MGEILRQSAEIFSAPAPQKYDRLSEISTIYKPPEAAVSSVAAMQDAAKDPVKRAGLLSVVDRLSHQESNRLKASGNLLADVVIIGSGPHATAFASSFLEKHAGAKILFVDKSPIRGGQFRQEGEAYQLNSPNMVLPQMKTPFETKTPNNLGENMILQPSDVASENLPLSHEVGYANAVNNFALGSALLGVEATSVEKNGNDNGRYKVLGKDGVSNKDIVIAANIVVDATGVGAVSYGLENEASIQSVIQEKRDVIVSFHEFLRLLSSLSPQAIQKRIQEGIAVVGGKGDSAKVALEKLIQKYDDKMASHAQVDVYGSDFQTSEEYVANSIDRYKQIGEYILPMDRIQQLKNNANNAKQWVCKHMLRINPKKEKVAAVGYEQGQVRIKDSNGNTRKYGLVIFATGFKAISEKLFGKLLQQKSFESVKNTSGGEIAKKVPGEDIFVIGPAAQIDYSPAEMSRVAANQKHRYKHSLARLIPKSMEAGEFAASHMMAAA